MTCHYDILWPTPTPCWVGLCPVQQGNETAPKCTTKTSTDCKLVRNSCSCVEANNAPDQKGAVVWKSQPTRETRRRISVVKNCKQIGVCLLFFKDSGSLDTANENQSGADVFSQFIMESVLVHSWETEQPMRVIFLNVQLGGNSKCWAAMATHAHRHSRHSLICVLILRILLQFATTGGVSELCMADYSIFSNCARAPTTRDPVCNVSSA